MFIKDHGAYRWKQEVQPAITADLWPRGFVGLRLTQGSPAATTLAIPVILDDLPNSRFDAWPVEHHDNPLKEKVEVQIWPSSIRLLSPVADSFEVKLIISAADWMAARIH